MTIAIERAVLPKVHEQTSTGLDLQANENAASFPENGGIFLHTFISRLY